MVFKSLNSVISDYFFLSSILCCLTPRLSQSYCNTIVSFGEGFSGEIILHVTGTCTGTQISANDDEYKSCVPTKRTLNLPFLTSCYNYTMRVSYETICYAIFCNSPLSVGQKADCGWSQKIASTIHCLRVQIHVNTHCQARHTTKSSRINAGSSLQGLHARRPARPEAACSG